MTIVMRKRADWMTRSDDEILEYLREEDAGTPKLIAEAIGRNNNYVTTRCRKLESYGLLKRPSRGFYTLSEGGRSYLEGELDASELDESTDENDEKTR
jgi:predicted transcriptional regulator